MFYVIWRAQRLQPAPSSKTSFDLLCFAFSNQLILTHGSLHSTTRDQPFRGTESTSVYLVKPEDSIKKGSGCDTQSSNIVTCVRERDWAQLDLSFARFEKLTRDDDWKSSWSTQQRRRQRWGGRWWQQRHFIAAAHRIGFPRSSRCSAGYQRNEEGGGRRGPAGGRAGRRAGDRPSWAGQVVCGEKPGGLRAWQRTWLMTSQQIPSEPSSGAQRQPDGGRYILSVAAAAVSRIAGGRSTQQCGVWDTQRPTSSFPL